jgi:hypothetical protein
MLWLPLTAGKRVEVDFAGQFASSSVLQRKHSVLCQGRFHQVLIMQRSGAFLFSFRVTVYFGKEASIEHALAIIKAWD